MTNGRKSDFVQAIARKTAGIKIIASVALLSGLLLTSGCSKFSQGDGVTVTSVAEVAKEDIRSSEEGSTYPEVIKGDQITLTAYCGYDKWVKAGRKLPVVAYFTNHGEDFVGDFYVTVTTSMTAEASYKKSLEIKSGETTRMELAVPAYGGYGDVNLSLNDNAGQTILKKEVQMKYTYYESTAYIGLLTDDSAFLNYLQGSGIKTFLLKPEFFPENQTGLDTLDGLVLHNFDRNQLNEKQQALLSAYEAAGNVQIINTEGKEGLAEEVLAGVSEEQKAQLAAEKRQDNHDYAAFSSVDTKDSNQLPKVWIYAIILAVYLLVIGPPTYLLLKKLDKPGLLWLVIPIWSILFTLVIYGVGSITRLTQPFIGYLTITDIGEKETRENVFFSLTSPYNNDYTVSLPSQYRVDATENRMSYSNYSSMLFNNIRMNANIQNQDRYNTIIQLDEKDTKIEIRNNSAFSSGQFKGSTTRPTAGRVESSLTMTKDFQITGTVTNHTGYDLKHVVLAIGDIYLLADELKNGETMQAEGLKRISITSLTMLYEQKIMEALVGGNAFGKTRNEEVSRTYYAYEYSLLCRYTQSNKRKDQLIGVEQSENGGELFSQTDLNRDGIHLVASDIEVEYTQGKEEFLPNLDSIMTTSDDYYPGYRYLNSENMQMVVHFQPNEIVKELIYSKELNSEFFPDSKSGFTGKVKAYNFQTEGYDTIFESGKEGSLSQLAPYLSNQNEMVLIYDVAGQTQTELALTAPVLSAVKEVR